MPIVPLPVFEKEADPQIRNGSTILSDEEIYARLEPPKTIVVKFGLTKMVGEFPYDGPAKPGCGSKLVARTFRGIEVVEMLTTTCSNNGCGKSISRNEMLDYIENSGGRDYPFNQKGRILRVATIDDLNRNAALDALRLECVRFAKQAIAELNLAMKLVEAEPILGGETITFYYMSEERVDFRELVNRLAGQFKTRIEMRQVGARDEARIVADYERCGQHCCCKNFLKVLKPVSMRAAKVQKATLDPLKISGRCGRLMCCLRYEDQTYKELKANLPSKNKRVGTSEGPGVVVDSKILVQLVLVRLEHDPTKEIAVPVEELMDPETCPRPGETQRRREEQETAFTSDPLRGLTVGQIADRTDEEKRSKRKRRRGRSKHEQQDAFRQESQQLDRPDSAPSAGTTDATDSPPSAGSSSAPPEQRGSRRRRRRRDRNRDQRPPQPSPDGTSASVTPQSSEGIPSTSDSASQGDGGMRKRRRRRRKRRGGGGENSGGADPTPPTT